MRITGPTRPSAPQAGGAARRAGGGAFAPASAEPPPRAAGGAAAAPLAGLDALIALQAIDPDRPGGRRRAVRHGHDLLDMLEEVKIGLLAGQVPVGALDRMLSILGAIEPSGDEQLDGLVADIRLRAEVELAKLGRFVGG